MGRELHFVSDDRLLGATIERSCLNGILRRCRDAGAIETGGVLIGRYSQSGDRVIVDKATGPPQDSIAGRISFLRGVRGLQRAIDRAWRGGSYYVGEWHFHPGGSPHPSSIDIGQMRVFSSDPDYRCPEPLLLVVGRTAARWRVSMTVLRVGEVVRLQPTSQARRSLTESQCVRER